VFRILAVDQKVLETTTGSQSPVAGGYGHMHPGRCRGGQPGMKSPKLLYELISEIVCHLRRFWRIPVAVEGEELGPA
jgi:hypothetical protein